jgi:hypothetical protein
MTTRFLFAAFALAFAPPHATAQLPVAPPPHPTLGELVEEYRRLGLPIPTPQAKLVRLSWGTAEAGGHGLTFRHPPRKPGGVVWYLTGCEWWLELNPLWQEEEVQPTASALNGDTPQGGICFAIQCKALGWDELAGAAYAAWRKDGGDGRLDEPRDLITTLRYQAWSYWEHQLFEEKSDRKEVLMRLTSLSKAGYERAPWRQTPILPDLERTVAPRTSKPGSVEALIDGLMEHWDDPEVWENEAGHTAYWKLAEVGLDAVPALMKHLDDTRFTRVKAFQGMLVGRYDVMRVNQLVEYLLEKMSGGRFLGEAYPLTVDQIREPKDHKWWAEARQVGEEKWLMTYVIPKDAEMHDQSPNEVLLRTIRVKYPHRLPDVYQTVLTKRTRIDSEQLLKAILESSLPRERKLALLEAGVTAEDARHRYQALEALAGVDAASFRRHLLRLLERIPDDLWIRHNGFNWDARVAGLVRQTDDAECWAALHAVVRRTSADCRLYFLQILGWPADPGEPDSGRRECLRYLLTQLDDVSVGKSYSGEWYAVRDFATIQLARVVGVLKVNLNKAPRSRRELSLLRDQVREVAERELARSAK